MYFNFVHLITHQNAWLLCDQHNSVSLSTVRSHLSEHVGTGGCSDNRNVQITEVPKKKMMVKHLSIHVIVHVNMYRSVSIACTRTCTKVITKFSLFLSLNSFCCCLHQKAIE